MMTKRFRSYKKMLEFVKENCRRYEFFGWKEAGTEFEVTFARCMYRIQVGENIVYADTRLEAEEVREELRALGEGEPEIVRGY